MKVDPNRLGPVIWGLIFGGMGVLALGLSLRATERGLASGFAIAGAVATLAGIVLIFLRARTLDRAPPAAAAVEPSDPATLPPEGSR